MVHDFARRPASLSLRAHYEDCIIYHEGVIARYEAMRAHLIASRRAQNHEIAALNHNLAHEQTILQRLLEAVIRFE